MKLERLILDILDESLSLQGRAQSFDRQTPLQGRPEMDSMAIVALLTALEDRLHVSIEFDELSGDIFATVGTLTDFVDRKVREA